MFKEENRQSQIQNRNAAFASLKNNAGKYFKKLYLGIKSISTYLLFRVKYGSKVEMCAINSLKGNFKVELFHDSSLKIGRFLMSAGSCYIKCTEGAQCKIGDNVFINHNCSITCVEKITIGDCCNIANNVIIVDCDHRLGGHGVQDGPESTPVYIGDNVWIGANAVILRGVSIVSAKYPCG